MLKLIRRNVLRIDRPQFFVICIETVELDFSADYVMKVISPPKLLAAFVLEISQK
jgi:hypothetical protein